MLNEDDMDYGYGFSVFSGIYRMDGFGSRDFSKVDAWVHLSKTQISSQYRYMENICKILKIQIRRCNHNPGINTDIVILYHKF